jgi:hypothetical protein
VVGSANLTSGLVANIETALVVTGQPGDAPIVDCWLFAEQLWEHPAAVDRTAEEAALPDEQFDPALPRMLRDTVPVGSVLPTSSLGRPNRVADVTRRRGVPGDKTVGSAGNRPPVGAGVDAAAGPGYLQRHGQPRRASWLW